MSSANNVSAKYCPLVLSLDVLFHFCANILALICAAGGVPPVLEECQVVNQAQSWFFLECDTSSREHVAEIYQVEVRHADSGALLFNASSEGDAAFEVRGLPEATECIALVFARNEKGRSEPARVVIKAISPPSKLLTNGPDGHHDLPENPPYFPAPPPDVAHVAPLDMTVASSLKRNQQRQASKPRRSPGRRLGLLRSASALFRRGKKPRTVTVLQDITEQDNNHKV
ncbi:kin of IRRE protein 1-like [Tropilaelaps mercedesae]|uniref:Kin of IRRE protein 1-like n=1 Tax=Tropilaelaps mercedesae TaxID=418985 RepID=A0A1V9Y0M5_9ACAR|nr:kin of IRRE protein 1-like [Tropilaelaps mercedesae]